MGAEKLWNHIIGELSERAHEIPTVTNLWFKASVDDGVVIIESAEKNQPSCKISMPRPLTKREFLKVYPYYERWSNKEKGVRLEVTNITMNSAYIFALISYFG